MNKIDELAKTLTDSANAKDKKKTSAYDTTANVVKVEGGTAWVSIPGGVEQTPATMAVSVKAGDEARVRVAGGKAYVVGNVTSPPTDDSYAKQAEAQALRATRAADAATDHATRAERAANSAIADAASANTSATNALKDAATARASAESAVEDAATAQAAAESAQADATAAKQDAASAKTSANEAKADAATAKSNAEAAVASASEAKRSAENANEYAARAIGGLTTIQSVEETLTWITQHGTMTKTTDTALDPTHVYFVQDSDGDYVVGNVHYSVVTEPNLEDIPTYYELSIDESLNNYVATHLAVTSEGLWIIPDAGGNKVLIATGQGSTYTTAGTYIVGSGGDVLAKFAESEVIIGKKDNTDAYLKLDYHSLQLFDKEGDTFLYISDLRDESGVAEIVETKKGDGATTAFYLDCPAANTNYTVEVDGTTSTAVTKRTMSVIFTTAPAEGAVITIKYTTTDTRAKAFSLGERKSGAKIGVYSFALGREVEASGSYSHAEGLMTTASGWESHAEGLGTTASGGESHAEGYNTTASGHYSHAQNYETIAAKEYQTAIGQYNLEDTEISETKQKALIIGNGTFLKRSNALTVDWEGNVEFAGIATGNNGTRDIELNITEATIAKYVALGMSAS